MEIETILVVSKQPRIQHLARQVAARLCVVDEWNDLIDAVNRAEPDMILLGPDVSMPQIQTLTAWLKKEERFIALVGVCDESNAVSAADYCAMGITNCIDNPENADQLSQMIQSLHVGPASQEEASRFFIKECPSSISIVGKSPAMAKLLKMIRIVSQSRCNPVLIVGETGTGKELAAQAVHNLRYGSNKKFVAVNCAALTANLLESELFGHVKGAFTGADRDKIGLLELASDGTIFLDEISEMPLDLQAKLLRVIQEKTFRKVGGIQDITTDATIIATSNRNLLNEVRLGKFRQDIYYRLAVCPIVLAPLRAGDRKEDILLLAEYFIQLSQICPEKKGKIKGLTKLATEMLLNHPWPGNVRELRNVIDRAVLLESGERIGTHNLFFEMETFEMEPQMSRPQTSSRIHDFSLEKAEKELVHRALEEAGGQKTRAAALLGITRATLYAKVKQYNLEQIDENIRQPA
jgi:two-component system NtrC family response regulator